MDPHAASQIFNVSPVQGSLAALGRNGIAVYKDVATANHLRLGSAVPVLFKDTGRQSLTVSVPLLTLLVVVVVAGLAGAAAAIWPSRRAAKLNILRALVTE